MSNKRYYFTSFKKVNEENVKERYQRNFLKWIFKESDKVWSDKNLLDKNKKFSYLMHDFNISPKPKKIECSALNDGIILTEGMFIDIELSKAKKIISDTKGSEENYLIHERGKIYLNYLQNRLENIGSPNVKKPIADVVALFCNLIDEMEIIQRKQNETIENFCKKVCENYNLTYTDRTRQLFSYSGYSAATTRNKGAFKNDLLPLIDKDTSKKISEYLNKKYPSIQTIYG